MKFYNRKSELEELHLIENLSNESAQLAVVVGRRRVGKTTLLRHAFTQIPVLYFFIGKRMKFFFVRNSQRKFQRS